MNWMACARCRLTEAMLGLSDLQERAWVSVTSKRGGSGWKHNTEWGQDWVVASSTEGNEVKDVNEVKEVKEVQVWNWR